jgi:polyvinyl alcohol dehydrogenase (cytochrome)
MRGRDYGMSSFSPVAGIAPSAVAALRPVWRFAADGAIPGSPAIDQHTVYVGSSRGTLYALDLGTGRLRWQMSLGARSQTAYGFPTLGINGTPMLADERVYVATAMTDVVCLDAATGGVMWRTRVGDPGKSETIWSAPLVWKNFVYVGIDGIYDEPTVGGRVVALEAATGRIVWTYTTPQYTGGGGAGVFDSPALDPTTRTLFVATGNPTPKDAPPPGPDPGSDSILALDAATGRLKWAFGPTHPHDALDLDFLGTPNILALPGGTAVGAGEKDGVYYVVDARTGKLVWKTSLSRGGTVASILGSGAVAFGKIFVGTQDFPPGVTTFSPSLPGRLVALEAATGRIVWQLGGAKQILGPPAVSKEGVVFAADYAGTVWGVDAQTGRPLWRGGTGGFAWKGGVSLAPGAVLVGAAAPGNALVAFGIYPSP